MLLHRIMQGLGNDPQPYHDTEQARASRAEHERRCVETAVREAESDVKLRDAERRLRQFREDAFNSPDLREGLRLQAWTKAAPERCSVQRNAAGEEYAAVPVGWPTGMDADDEAETYCTLHFDPLEVAQEFAKEKGLVVEERVVRTVRARTEDDD